MIETRPYLQLVSRPHRPAGHRRRHAVNYYVMGQQCAEDGMLDEARRLFTRAIACDPYAAQALHALAGVEFSQNNLPEARRLLSRALALTPNDPFFYLMLGNIELGEGHPTAALDAYQRAESLGDDSPELLYNLGIAYLFTGHLVEAERVFADLVEEQPLHQRAWDGLGCARRMRKDYDGATNAFLRALQIDPGLNDARDHLAQLLIETGNVRRAQQVLEAALAFEPERPSSRHLLGMALAAMREYEEAIACWETLVEQGGATPDTYHLLANSYLQIDERDAAIATLTILVTLAPNHLSGHLQLALLYMETGDAEHGWEHLERAKEIDPNNPTLLHVLTAANGFSQHVPPTKMV